MDVRRLQNTGYGAPDTGDDSSSDALSCAYDAEAMATPIVKLGPQFDTVCLFSLLFSLFLPFNICICIL